MSLFVVLGNFTQKRMETIKGLPESVKEGPKAFESFGVKIKELVFTMGRYDLVAIGEAPDAEAITKALLSWGSKGLLRTETLTGFTGEEMSELVKGIDIS
ncbi:MAG: GYD domain-containing protein [Candidatus Bathyarchaeota archaeon]|nr:GYD domain-containing protein [Candidatus Bathyarchaeota archaeon]